MDFLFEFLAELISEGIVELIQNKKVPLWIRGMLLLVMSFIYLSIVGLMFYLGIRSNSFAKLLLLSLIGVMLFMLYVAFIYKLCKKRS